MQIGFSQRLVNTRLIGAKSAAPLQQQGNPLEGRALGCDMGFPPQGPVTGHSGLVHECAPPAARSSHLIRHETSS